MPCRCDGFEDEPTVLKRTYDKMGDELDRVTQLLCYCCGTMHKTGAGGDWPKELVEWFQAHHEDDRKRVLKQMLDTLAKKNLPVVTNSAEMDLAGMFMDAAKKQHPVSKWHEQWFFDMAHEAWEIHSKSQKQKKKKQDIAKQALAKLSPEERKALGL